MHTLILDTTGTYSTLALARESTLVGYSTMKAQPLTHLHEEIRHLTAKLSVGMDSIALIGVVTGPGSWTGLNIGVTAAKTLAQVLGAGVVGLSTLDVLVAAERWTGGRVSALLDAKRGNVYCATYPTDEVGRVDLAQGRRQVLAFEDWCETLDEGGPLVVEYGQVFRDRIAERLPAASRINRDFLTPDGLLAALLACQDRMVSGAEAMQIAPDYMQKIV